MTNFLHDLSRALVILIIIALGGGVGAVFCYFLFPESTHAGMMLGACATAGLLLYHSWMMKVPPIPLPRAVQQAMIEAIPDGTGDIYELGCGFGHLAVALARHFPGRKIVAIEYSMIPFLAAWIWANIGGYKNLSVRRADFFNVDLSDAEILTSYLYPPLMGHVGEKLLASASRAQMLLNVNFPIPDLTPVQIINVPRLGSPIPDEIFIYRLGD